MQQIESREEIRDKSKDLKSKGIKGFCVDCLFIRQEWTVQGVTQQKLVLDRFCFLCDIFKKPDGFCDCWEHK